MPQVVKPSVGDTGDDSRYFYFGIASMFVAVLAWQGALLCLATTQQISPALGLPMGFAYLAIPVGAGIMALQSILFACFPRLIEHWSPSVVAEAGPAS